MLKCVTALPARPERCPHKMDIKPNFFIIGAAKAATTSLSSMLSLHPEAGIVRGKEPHFLSFNVRFALGWAHYRQLFSHCAGKRAVGDASTSYSRIRTSPETIGRMGQHFPEARIIYMVRHPLKRMESAYIQLLCSPGYQVFLSINDAVLQQPMIVDSSRYWEVFDAYRRQFGEARIKIIWFEDYVANPAAVFAEVCRFLDIDDTLQLDFDRQQRNSSADVMQRLAALNRQRLRIDTEWDSQTKQYVLDLIGDDVRRFLAYFGRQSDTWNDLF
jgi:Sulfotransferase family